MQVTQGLISLLAFTAIFSNNPKLIAPISDDLIVREKIIEEKQEEILAVQSLDLNKRDENEFINNVFKENILLSLSRIPGPAWNGFILQPGEVFAFHENVLPEYKEKVVKTMGSKFIASEGYLSSGWIFGDGVCHLASLMNWTATEAGLEIIAKVKHNFRPIPSVPRDYWTSIRYSKSGNNSQNQNLYIINRFDYTVEFRFKVDENKLELEILKRN